MVVIRTSADDCPNVTHQSREEKHRSFSIFTRKSTDEGTGGTDDEKLIPSELGDGRDGDAQFDGNNDGSGGEQWTLKSEKFTRLEYTKLAAKTVAPKPRIVSCRSFCHWGQLSGSLGSSEGWGVRMRSELLPLPCLRPWVSASECASRSFSRTVPGTCGSLWSRAISTNIPSRGGKGHTF